MKQSSETDLGLLNTSAGPDRERDGEGERFCSVRWIYETDAEVVGAIVPQPLEPLAAPEVEVRVDAHLHRPESSISEAEVSASFAVRVSYDDRPGLYPLTVPMSSETAVALSRERFGEPSKLARIDFGVTESTISVAIERMGFQYLRAAGKRDASLGERIETSDRYCFKAFPGCTGHSTFDQDPQLICVRTEYACDRVERIEGGVELWDSPFDPVADLPVRRMASFEYLEGRSRRSAQVVRPVPGEWLAPFLHQRYDNPKAPGVEV